MALYANEFHRSIAKTLLISIQYEHFETELLTTVFGGKGKKKAGDHFGQKNALSLPCKAIFVFGKSSAKFWIPVQTFGQKTPSHFRQKFRIILDLSAHFRTKNTIA